MSVIPGTPFLPKCTNENIYPLSLLTFFYAQVFVFSFSWILFSNNYFAEKKLIQGYERRMGKFETRDLMLNKTELLKMCLDEKEAKNTRIEAKKELLARNSQSS